MISNIFASFTGLSNIEEQRANPAGIRMVGVVAVSDIRDNVNDWPWLGGAIPDIVLSTLTIRRALPLKKDCQIAIITPADNSAFMTFENQGDRYYQAYKYAIGFDLAGLTKAQSSELRKFVNTGAIFFVQSHDGDIRVIGSKLNPIVLKSKGDTGKKGGDKKGYSLSGDNDNFMIEPPYYPEDLPLYGINPDQPGGFSHGFSLAFTS